MKLHYSPETDSLYIEFRPEPGADVRQISEGVTADLAGDGSLVGLDIEHASTRTDLSTLETIALPLSIMKAA